jgi:hypothetical protein
VIEYLLAVAPNVFRSELRAGALTYSKAVILAILKLTQLHRRRQLPAVLIRDPGIGKCPLQAPRVRPGVLGPAYPASLADVEQLPNSSCLQRG